MKSTKKELIQKATTGLKKVLKFVGIIPDEGIFMGLASDQLPVLFDVSNPEPSNIVIWDKLYKQGLRILKVMAEYIFYHRENSYKVEFVVFTKDAEDWGDLNKYGMGANGDTSCIGIIPFNSDIAEKVALGLCHWIHESHNASKKPVLIFVDGLDNLEKTSLDFRSNFRYLLEYGHSKSVYVLATASKDNFGLVHDWLDGFHAEIYGCSVENLFEMLEKKNKVYFLVPNTEFI